MTKIKARDLRKLSKEELSAKLLDLRKDLIKVNAQRSTGTAIENPGRIKQVRKTIARILTIINEKPTKAEPVKVEPVKTKKLKPKKEASENQ
jgi:large subunit ribosomal protein L29